MIQENFNLSERAKQHDSISCDKYYDEEDVKEFIEKIKENIKAYYYKKKAIIGTINGFAGENFAK